MTITEIKEFIIWMKANKVKKFKNSDFEMEMSDIAFIDELNVSQEREMVLGGSKDLHDTAVPQTDEENESDLFWSCGR